MLLIDRWLRRLNGDFTDLSRTKYFIFNEILATEKLETDLLYVPIQYCQWGRWNLF